MEIQAKLLTEMSFAIETDSGYHVILDTNDADAKEAAHPCPTELLLVALAGCMGMSLTTILNKMKQPPLTYEIHVQATKKQRPPYTFETIRLEHILSGQKLEASAIQRALTLAEERYCAVGLMLKEAINVTHTFRIVI